VATESRRSQRNRVPGYTAKPTALLVDSLQSVGDFGQHRHDFPESNVSKGFVASQVLSAIELVESLARDLLRENHS
jgi:hypothetical protein